MKVDMKGVSRCRGHEHAQVGINSVTSSYPGWIKSPHVVTLSILKISDLDSLTIYIGGGIPE